MELQLDADEYVTHVLYRETSPYFINIDNGTKSIMSIETNKRLLDVKVSGGTILHGFGRYKDIKSIDPSVSWIEFECEYCRNRYQEVEHGECPTCGGRIRKIVP